MTEISNIQLVQNIFGIKSVDQWDNQKHSLTIKNAGSYLRSPITPLLSLHELEVFCEENLGIYELIGRIFQKQIQDNEFFSIAKFWEFNQPQYSWVRDSNLPIGLFKIIQSFHDISRIVEDFGIRSELTYQEDGNYAIYLSQRVTEYDSELKTDRVLYWVDLPWKFTMTMRNEQYEVNAVWDFESPAIQTPSVRTNQVHRLPLITEQVVRGSTFFTASKFQDLEIFLERYSEVFGYQTSIPTSDKYFGKVYLRRST